MKSKGKIISALLIGTVAAALSTNVHAYSANLTMSSSVPEIKAGETATITVGVSNIDVETGIEGFEANLKYDHNVFEKVEQSDITAGSKCAGWSLSYNSNETNQKITLLDTVSGSSINDTSTLFTITLKAKESVGSGSTSVSLDGLFCGGSDEDGVTAEISPQTKSVSLNVVGASSDNPITPSDETGSEDNSEDEVPTTLKVTKGDSTKAENKIPQTGENDVAIYTMAGVSLVALVSLAGYIKYRKDVK